MSCGLGCGTSARSRGQTVMWRTWYGPFPANPLPPPRSDPSSRTFERTWYVFNRPLSLRWDIMPRDGSCRDFETSREIAFMGWLFRFRTGVSDRDRRRWSQLSIRQPRSDSQGFIRINSRWICGRSVRCWRGSRAFMIQYDRQYSESDWRPRYRTLDNQTPSSVSTLKGDSTTRGPRNV